MTGYILVGLLSAILGWLLRSSDRLEQAVENLVRLALSASRIGGHIRSALRPLVTHRDAVVATVLYTLFLALGVSAIELVCNRG